MNDGSNAFLAIVGSGSTIALTDVNPYLAFACGVLTLVHLTWSLSIMWKKHRQGK